MFQNNVSLQNRPALELDASEAELAPKGSSGVRKSLQMLFSGPMVLANLAGLKNQTRRRVSPELVWGPGGISWKGLKGLSEREFVKQALKLSPYGAAGTVIKVKENCWMWCDKQPNGVTPTGRPKFRYIPVGQHVVYAAEHPQKPTQQVDKVSNHGWRLKVARFMPAWAVRTRLKVAEVRLERLQAISKEDAIGEGLVELASALPRPWPWHWNKDSLEGYATPWMAYRALWTQINGAQSWAENELVWVIRYSPVLDGQTTESAR